VSYCSFAVSRGIVLNPVRSYPVTSENRILNQINTSSLRVKIGKWLRRFKDLHMRQFTYYAYSVHTEHAQMHATHTLTHTNIQNTHT
jgi:hypothetical protein